MPVTDSQTRYRKSSSTSSGLADSGHTTKADSVSISSLSNHHSNQAPAQGTLPFKVFIALIVATSVFVLFQLPLGRLVGIHTSKTPLSGFRTGVAPTLTADVPRRDAVVEAFKHAWSAYERDAMGDDEYHPLSHRGSNLTKAGGIGQWVQNHLSFDRDANFSTFETTIRILGGLLAAYHLSEEDPIFLEKAQDLGNRILPVFETPSGLPLSLVNLHRREGVPDPDNIGLVSTAEAATLQLEFRYLSYLTDEDTYWEKAEEVMTVLKAARLPHGLVPIFIDPKSGRYRTASIRLGSRGDSYYEYLLHYFQNQTEGVYRELYDHAMTGIHDHLVQKSISGKLVYTAEFDPRGPQSKLTWELVPKQDHLVCFLGGSLMLGATTAGALVDRVSVPPLPHELSEQAKRDWLTGVELVKTCMATHDTHTGLAAEIVHFRTPRDNVIDWSGRTDWYIKGSKPGQIPSLDARYILRPETVESLFLAFRLTGDASYRDQGWAIFQAIEKHCRVPSGGFASVKNVDQVPVEQEDKMETFLMSETLKYLYLLFSDASVLPLNEYVFNTEVPLLMPTSESRDDLPIHSIGTSLADFHVCDPHRVLVNDCLILLALVLEQSLPLSSIIITE
ncbi:glycoside hydrolase family 47 protein [Lanmaoa asiatica]|nr:glycoside hydrolase family 47 protein [Lanmaoa asiatica]